jgi:hypothetical protein
MSFLDGGGNLYFESVNIGFDYNSTEFFDYFGIYYLGDGGDNEVINLKGTCNNCSGDLKFDYLGGVDPHLSVDRLETDGGEVLFSSDDGIGRVIINENGNHKTIASSIVIGAVANADSLNLKPYLFSEYINYFIGYNPITDLRENISQFLNGGNYPNPFSDQTTVMFDTRRNANVEVNIYNISGQLVKNLVDEHFKPGKYNVIWDATDQSGNKVDNGYYFCRITSGDDVITKKMVLLR